VPTWLPDERTLLCPSAEGIRTGENLRVPQVPPTAWSDFVYWAGWCDDDQPGAMIVADDRSDRHNEGADYLFTDGHVKWMRAQNLRGHEHDYDYMVGWKELKTLRADKFGHSEPVLTPPEEKGD
jgi:prepilin-type processing-associated H-X9-DG protein